jgi:hypothetical protein
VNSGGPKLAHDHGGLQTHASRQAEHAPEGGHHALAYHSGATTKRSLPRGLQRGLLPSHRGCAVNWPCKVRGAGPHPSGGAMCRHGGVVVWWCSEAAAGF